MRGNFSSFRFFVLLFFFSLSPFHLFFFFFQLLCLAIVCQAVLRYGTTLEEVMAVIPEYLFDYMYNLRLNYGDYFRRTSSSWNSKRGDLAVPAGV